MQYANINSVYDFLKRVANKNQQGFFTSVDYNRFAYISQMDVAREALSEIKRVRNRQPIFAKNMMGVLDENLAKTILAPLLVPEENLPYVTGDDAYTYPTYYMDTLALVVAGQLTDISDAVEALLTKGTSLLNAGAVTTVAYAVSKGIRVLQPPIVPPAVPLTVQLTYYKVPRGTDSTGTPVANAPLWSSITVSSGSEIFNPSTSVNFELPEQAERLIAYRIAQYLGINLRDSDLYQFGATEEAKDMDETKIAGQ